MMNSKPLIRNGEPVKHACLQCGSETYSSDAICGKCRKAILQGRDAYRIELRPWVDIPWTRRELKRWRRAAEWRAPLAQVWCSRCNGLMEGFTGQVLRLTRCPFCGLRGRVC